MWHGPRPVCAALPSYLAGFHAGQPVAVKTFVSGDRLGELRNELQAVCTDNLRRTFASAVAIFPGSGPMPPAIVYERMSHAGLDVKAR